MENLLRIEFTSHYGLNIKPQVLSRNTNSDYFELKDDLQLIELTVNSGSAKFRNSSRRTVTVIHYEEFIKLLPEQFKNGRSVCDLITFTKDGTYFLLNELTSTLSDYVHPFENWEGLQPGKMAKAVKQLISTLTDLTEVPPIKSFINAHVIKQCCFFNKQSNAPYPIKATEAFNRLNSISINGLKMSNLSIESFGFEFYEYSGNQVYTLS